MSAQIPLEQLHREAIVSARKRMGDFAWGTVGLVAFVVSAYLTTLYLFWQGVFPAWLSFVLVAALTYGSYTPLHEAAHGNIHGRHEPLRWVNELCGFLCAPGIMLPHSSHRLEHMNHHRFTNDRKKDPDAHIQSMAHGLLPWLASPWKLLFIHVTYIFRCGHWQTKATAGEKIRYLAEIVFMLGWRVAFLTQVPLVPGLLVIVGGYVVGAYFTVYWFAFRPHQPYDRVGRYVDTASLIPPRWLRPFEWIWLGQTLHSVHHAFPRVPFYRYHGLFREIEPVMRAHGGRSVDMLSRKPVASR